jgi:hypothetical protein
VLLSSELAILLVWFYILLQVLTVSTYVDIPVFVLVTQLVTLFEYFYLRNIWIFYKLLVGSVLHKEVFERSFWTYGLDPWPAAATFLRLEKYGSNFNIIHCMFWVWIQPNSFWLYANCILSGGIGY